MGKKKKPQEHMKDPADWKFKRSRNGDEHARNCKSGYYGKRPMKFGEKDMVVTEIHHVLCVHACSDDTHPSDLSEDELTFIHKSLAITDWNINEGHNNIGLPRKWAYVLDTGNATGWDGLPCHQVDHDIYLDTVKQWVTEEIWNKIKANKTEGNCENMEGSAVAQLFKDGSVHWKSFLEERGKMHGGTKACLDYCMRGVPDPAKDDVWHVPFSMACPANDIRRRTKPPKSPSLQMKMLLGRIK